MTKVKPVIIALAGANILVLFVLARGNRDFFEKIISHCLKALEIRSYDFLPCSDELIYFLCNMTTVILVGFMGSGKSTLGTELARRLNVPFVDSDQLIEQQEQATISQLFLEKGEDYFRTKELELILNMDFHQPKVLATGGGLPCYNDLMTLLNKKGVTIYLKTSPETLYTRLLHDMEDRPLLEGMGEYELKMYIKDKLAERETIYRKAQITLDEKDHTASEIIRRLDLLRKN